MNDQRDAGTGRSRSIAPNKGAIWTERALLALIVGSLAATFNLLVALQRHASPTSVPPDPPLMISQQVTPPASPRADKAPTTTGDSGIAQPAIIPKAPEPVSVAPPPEDPTKKSLAGLANATAREVEAREEADRRALALEIAREASSAESRRWKRRELLVRQQIAGLAARADELETTVSTLDAERDVLARERDALKAALFKASQRSGFAVLPYKGPNGTWRRPIVLECTSGGVKLQPKGPRFTSLELSPLVNPRSSPLVRAVAREMLQVQASDTPDGAAAVPYLVFLVRPNGIRPYYEARTCLEPLGIAFGYELIEQDLTVDIPDFNNVATWDGSVPLDIPVEPAPGPKVNVAMDSARDRSLGASARWPETSGRAGQPSAAKSGDGDSATPEDFVWPSRGRQSGTGDGGNSGSVDSGQGGAQGTGDGAGLSVRGPEGGRPGFPGTGPSSGSFGSQPSSSGGNLGNGAFGSGTLSGGNLRNGAFGSGTQSGGSLGSGTALGSSGSARQSGIGSGSYPTPGNGMGSYSTSGGGSGPGSSVPASSTGNLAAVGRSPTSPGSLSGASAGTGVSALPDLEPAGDGGSGQPGQDGSGSSAAKPSGAGSGAGTLPQLPGAGGVQSGVGDSGVAGSGSTATTSDGAGRSQGTGSTPTGQSMDPPATGSGSSGADPAAAARSSPSLDGRPAPVGSAGNNSGSGSAGGDPASQPYQAQPLGDREGSQEPSGSSGTLGVVSSAAATGQPSTSIYMPGGLTAASSASASGSGVGAPSTSTSSSNSSMGGMPLDSLSSSSSSSSSSAFGQNASAASNSSSSDDMIFAPAPRQAPPPGSIEVPFEIVVVCRENDILLHPGGYRLSSQAMRQQGVNKDSLLAREIVAMVRKRAIVDPVIRPRPKIKFLLETNGSETFWTARRQLLFSLPDWPMSLQISGTQDMHVFTKETW